MARNNTDETLPHQIWPTAFPDRMREAIMDRLEGVVFGETVSQSRAGVTLGLLR